MTVAEWTLKPYPLEFFSHPMTYLAAMMEVMQEVMQVVILEEDWQALLQAQLPPPYPPLLRASARAPPLPVPSAVFPPPAPKALCAPPPAVSAA
mmetsp:Transcript_36777/g.86233  ORF Transcript_36777/g.86233 Transcript_36777/m.86233 type:complete len:94 (+) Transcript_36777:1818-2099(+)